MNTRLTPIVLCLIGWACLSAQPQFAVIQQASGTDYVLFEAEDFQNYDPPFLASQRAWDTDSQGGDTFLEVVPGSSYGNNPSKTVALEAAKAQYTVQFATTGTYYFYFRYAKQGGGTGSADILTPFSYGYLPRKQAELSAPGSGLRWAEAVEKSNGRTLVFHITDIDRLYTFAFAPGDNDSQFDQILFHKAPDISFIDFNSLNTATLAKSQVPANTLQFTNFAGEPAEYRIDATASDDIAIVDESGVGDGRSFADLGSQNILLDVSMTDNQATLAFETINLACGYTNLEICFSYFIPYKNNNVFQPSDNLQLIVNLNDGNNVYADDVLYSVAGGNLNVATDHYVQVCGSINVPAGRNLLDARIVLNADKDDEDLFIGQVYIKAASAPSKPQIDVQYSIPSSTFVDFDLSASVDAGFFSYQFGDGTPPTELVTDDMPVYFYPDMLVYEACFVAYDLCGNQPEQLCFPVDLLTPFPVEWLSFTARPENQDVRLNWATAQEVDNDHFVVEFSQNGQQFTALDRVETLGNTQQISQYTYLHQRPGDGTLYYRIRQVDVDGKFSFSPIQTVRQEGVDKGVDVYPNPAYGYLYVALKDDTAQNLILVNALGQQVRQWSTRSERPELDISGIKAGWYSLRALSAEGNVHWVKKVLIEE